MLDHSCPLSPPPPLQPNTPSTPLRPHVPPPHPPLVPPLWNTCVIRLQKEEWTAADGTFKLHKSKLELAKEEAAAARSNLKPSLHTLPALLMLVARSSVTGLVQLATITMLLASESIRALATNCMCWVHSQNIPQI